MSGVTLQRRFWKIGRRQFRKHTFGRQIHSSGSGNRKRKYLDTDLPLANSVTCADALFCLSYSEINNENVHINLRPKLKLKFCTYLLKCFNKFLILTCGQIFFCWMRFGSLLRLTWPKREVLQNECFLIGHGSVNNRRSGRNCVFWLILVSSTDLVLIQNHLGIIRSFILQTYLSKVRSAENYFWGSKYEVKICKTAQNLNWIKVQTNGNECPSESNEIGDKQILKKRY